MSEKNWPEPVAIRYSPSFIFPDVVLKPYDPSILENVKKHTATQAEVLYTAAQVREIVAAEVAEHDKWSRRRQVIDDAFEDAPPLTGLACGSDKC